MADESESTETADAAGGSESPDVTETAARERPAVGLGTIAVRGAVAIGLALLVNGALLGVVQASGLVDPFGALTAPPVLFLTGGAAVGATVVYAIFHRITSVPDRSFLALSALVLVLSFVPTTALLWFDPAATILAVVVLLTMHVTVAAICVGVLTGIVALPIGGGSTTED